MCGDLVLIGKDRPGEIRPHCGSYKAGDRTQKAALMIVDSTDESGIKVTLQATEGEPTTWGTKRRPGIMQAVLELLENFPAGLTHTQTRKHVKCRSEYAGDACRVLTAEKYITSVPYEHRSNYSLWISVKLYREKTDPVLCGESAPGGEGSE